MRDIDNDPKVVASPDHLRAEIGQTSMLGWFSLDIAEFVHPVVHQLQMTQLMLRVRLIHAIQLPLEKIAPF